MARTAPALIGSNSKITVIYDSASGDPALTVFDKSNGSRIKIALSSNPVPRPAPSEFGRFIDYESTAENGKNLLNLVLTSMPNQFSECGR